MVSQSAISQPTIPDLIRNFPFDVIEMKGTESVEFLHRITTHDLSGGTSGSIRFTLLVSDKGRIIDTAWVIQNDDGVLLLVSSGMASEIIPWLLKYIIMEEIAVTDVSGQYSVTMRTGHESSYYCTEYFGLPVTFELTKSNGNRSAHWDAQFERWRIEHGIPKARHEMVQDYNPLELNLWNWISFTKGCYIGQEVIARLDTYNKVQRALCRISADREISQGLVLCDHAGTEIGKVTSVLNEESGSIGLAVIRTSAAAAGNKVLSKDTSTEITIEHVFRKTNGRDQNKCSDQR